LPTHPFLLLLETVLSYLFEKPLNTKNTLIFSGFYHWLNAL
jgi:hypothetical protein